jgi:hypothetical protein
MEMPTTIMVMELATMAFRVISKAVVSVSTSPKLPDQCNDHTKEMMTIAFSSHSPLSVFRSGMAVTDGATFAKL